MAAAEAEADHHLPSPQGHLVETHSANAVECQVWAAWVVVAADAASNTQAVSNFNYLHQHQHLDPLFFILVFTKPDLSELVGYKETHEGTNCAR